MINLKRKITVFLVFLVYLAFLVCILFFGGRHASHESFSTYIHSNVNLIPFKTIQVYYNGYINHRAYSSIAFTNLVANLLIFLPMGIFIPSLFKKTNIIKFIILTFMILLGVETLQLVLKIGIFDIDDIILNFSGAFLGYILYKIYSVIKKYNDGSVSL